MPGDRRAAYARRAKVATRTALMLAVASTAVLAIPLWLALPEKDFCWWHPQVCADNQTYAAKFFADLVPIQAVLESRAWHTPPNLALDGKARLIAHSLSSRFPTTPHLCHPFAWASPPIRHSLGARVGPRLEEHKTRKAGDCLWQRFSGVVRTIGHGLQLL